MKVEWKTCIRLGITVFVVFLGIYYWGSLTKMLSLLLDAAQALIFGCIIAYFLNILMSFYERHYFPKAKAKFWIKSRRPVCMVGAMMTLVGIIALVIYLVIPELIACIKLLAAEVPGAVDTAVAWLKQQEALSGLVTEELLESLSSIDWQSKVTQVAGVILEGLGGAAQMAISAVSSVISTIAKLVIGCIFAVYLLTGKERLAGQFEKLANRYLRPAWKEKIQYVLFSLNNSFHRFIVGQCVEAVILGVLCIIGMWIFRFPYAVMIGTLIGFTALIPVAGAYIGAGVGAFMILTASSPMKAIGFLIFIVVLQQLEGNLIYPKVVGKSIGLPGIWVLTAVTVGGGLFGIPGMLVAVPTTATVYQILKQKVNEPKKSKVQIRRSSWK